MSVEEHSVWQTLKLNNVFVPRRVKGGLFMVFFEKNCLCDLFSEP
jgi:hypothetical protein